jgi:2-hydroxy-3-keto-5-methylthiopentenyl-1-phosphate phosphatase
LYTVLDWDGTATVRDTLWMLLERFGDREVFERMERALGTTHSHQEVMEIEMATIGASLEEVSAFLVEEVELRPGFHAFVDRFRPLVLSSGFHETIEPVLAREHVEVDVVANRVDARPTGWRVRWQDPAPCPECGDLCKRRALPAGRPIAYIGDGYSDRCAALAADRVFARGTLAEYLTSRNLPYEPFETLDDVAARLS